VRSFSIGGGIVFAAVLAACGGGGGGAGSVAPGTATNPVGAKAVFTIVMGNGNGTSSSARSPKFVDSATQSMSIAVTQVNGAAPATAVSPTIVNVGATAAGCTTSGSTIGCTISVGAVVGSDTFTITAYAQPNGAGAALSSGSTTLTITQGGPNTGALVLGGIPASVAVSVTNGNNLIPGGYATTLPVAVTAKDASGATIIGTYANPITLTDADTSGTITTVSPTSITSSSTAVTFTYAPSDANTGVLAISGLPAGATTIGASASGVPAAAITSGTFQYIADRFPGYGITRLRTGIGNVTTTTFNASGVPSPNPSTWAYIISDAGTVHAGATFNGLPVNDVNDVYTYLQTSPATNTVPEMQTEDTFRHPTLTSTGAILYLYGQRFVNVNAGTISSPITGYIPGTVQDIRSYPATGAWQDDVFPHTSTNWSNNNVPFADVYTNAEVATFQLNADGSSSFTETVPFPITQTQSANGAATNNFSNVFPNNGVGTATISAPVPAPNGTGFVIPVVLQQMSPTPAPATSAQVPDWYPGGGAPPQPPWQYAYSESPASVPSICNLASSIPTQGFVIVRQFNELRIPNFQTQQRTYSDYYVSGLGYVCETLSQTNTSYRFGTGIVASQTVITWVLGLNTQGGTVNLTGSARAAGGHVR